MSKHMKLREKARHLPSAPPSPLSTDAHLTHGTEVIAKSGHPTRPDEDLSGHVDILKADLNAGILEASTGDARTKAKGLREHTDSSTP